MRLLPIKSYGEQVGKRKNVDKKYETEKEKTIDYFKCLLNGHEEIMEKLRKLAKRYDKEKRDPEKKKKCERDIYEIYESGKSLREGFHNYAAEAEEIFNGEVKEFINKVKEKQVLEEQEMQKLIKDAKLVMIGWQETMYK
jgi:Zn-dependent oligopeptidase